MNATSQAYLDAVVAEDEAQREKEKAEREKQKALRLLAQKQKKLLGVATEWGINEVLDESPDGRGRPV